MRQGSGSPDSLDEVVDWSPVAVAEALEDGSDVDVDVSEDDGEAVGPVSEVDEELDVAGAVEGVEEVEDVCVPEVEVADDVPVPDVELVAPVPVSDDDADAVEVVEADAVDDVLFEPDDGLDEFVDELEDDAVLDEVELDDALVFEGGPGPEEVVLLDAVDVPDEVDVPVDEDDGGGGGGGGELPVVGGPCVEAVAEDLMVTVAAALSLPSPTVSTTGKSPVRSKTCSTAIGSSEPERGVEPSPRSRVQIMASPSGSRAPREKTTLNGVRPLDGVACREADGGTLPGTVSLGASVVDRSRSCVPGAGWAQPPRATAATSRARVAGMRMMVLVSWPHPIRRERSGKGRDWCQRQGQRWRREALVPRRRRAVRRTLGEALRGIRAIRGFVQGAGDPTPSVRCARPTRPSAEGAGTPASPGP